MPRNSNFDQGLSRLPLMYFGPSEAVAAGHAEPDPQGFLVLLIFLEKKPVTLICCHQPAGKPSAGDVIRMQVILVKIVYSNLI